MLLNSDFYSELIVICAHPDDECLMAGSLIESFIQKGKKVKVLFYSHETQLAQSKESSFVTRDQSSLFLKPLIHLKQDLVKEFQEVCTSEVIEYQTLSLLDQKFQFYDYGEISSQVSGFLGQSNEDSLVVIHHQFDINEDHQIVAKTCHVALRKHLFKGTVIEGYVHGSTKLENFAPNVFIDSEPYIESKISRFQMYKNQQRENYHPRSTYALKSVESFFGTYFGIKYAESYRLI